jgi:histidinol-phosphate aminotransferase
VAQILDAVRPPQNISAFGIEAACRALGDQSALQSRVSQLWRERDRFGQALVDRGWEVVPSQANFVLGRPPVDAIRLARWLQGAGLIARSFGGHPRLKDWLRLTVRAPEEDDRLLARFEAFPG